MSNVLDLPIDADAPLLPHRRLLLLSRGLSVLFTGLIGLCVLWTIGAFVIVFFYADHVRVGASGALLAFPKPPDPMAGTVLFSTQPFMTRVAGFIDILIGMAPVM